jgi:hypothetical protein
MDRPASATEARDRRRAVADAGAVRALATALALVAFLPSSESRAEEPAATGVRVDRGGAAPRDLPAIGDVAAALADLEVPSSESPRVACVDVDNDGACDWLVEAGESLCGTGGCPYVLLDGRSGRRLGDFFGSPIVVFDHRRNGLRVVEAFQHLGAESAALVTYEFDGTAYRTSARAELDGGSATALLAKWGELPAAGAPR